MPIIHDMSVPAISNPVTAAPAFMTSLINCFPFTSSSSIGVVTTVAERRLHEVLQEGAYA